MTILPDTQTHISVNEELLYQTEKNLNLLLNNKKISFPHKALNLTT